LCPPALAESEREAQLLAGISSSVVSSQIVFQESKDKIVVFPVFMTKGAGPKEVNANGH
jgi:hypothetical protein